MESIGDPIVEIKQEHFSDDQVELGKFFTIILNNLSFFRSSLYGHIKWKHLPRDSNPNKCSKCGKIFSGLSTFRNHTKFCGQPKDAKQSLIRFFCDHCGYKTDRKSCLVDYMQAKHLAKNFDSNKCSKCGKNYFRRSYLIQHLKFCGQTNEAKRSLMCYSCDDCKYKANRKSHLLRHNKKKTFTTEIQVSTIAVSVEKVFYRD